MTMAYGLDNISRTAAVAARELRQERPRDQRSLNDARVPRETLARRRLSFRRRRRRANAQSCWSLTRAAGMVA